MSLRSPARTAPPAAALLTLLAACGGDAARQPDAAAPGEIDLVARLDEASIDSPLTTIAAADAALFAALPRREVFAQDFDKPRIARVLDEQDRGASIEEVDGRRALRLHRLAASTRVAWTLPAQPNTIYLFKRAMRSDTPQVADFAVVEARRRSPVGGPFHPGYLRNSRDALRVHWPRSGAAAGGWQQGSASFFTTSRTTHLVVMLHSVDRRDARAVARGLGSSPRFADLACWFDDLSVARVTPTREQRIAVMKARANAPGDGEALGMHKRGQLPPLGEAFTERSPIHDNFSIRDALYAPPPTDIAYGVRIPEAASLYFSTCLARESPVGSAARFEVVLRPDGGGEEVIWSDVLRADPGQWLWHDQRVDLAPWAGRAVTLVLRTRRARGDPHPAWGNPAIAPRPRGDRPRNIILIAVDTLRADRLSCYGHELATSPNIDALAADGVRFANVACNANWTCPSFASIFTGVVPSRHGVFAMDRSTELPQAFETLAERLRAARFATHSIAYKAPIYGGGFDQGFAVAFNVPRRDVRAQENLDEALEWLERNAERRNFLFLHFDDPHQPFNQPAPFDRAFGAEPPAGGLADYPHIRSESTYPDDEAVRAAAHRLYDGEVAYVDDRIGVFLAALKQRGLYDDALIVFVSDHGEQIWERGHFGHGTDKLHDAVVRVPLIVKAPRGDGPRGLVVPTQVRAFDLMPTILELAGLDPGDGLDARSLLPLLAAEPTAAALADRLAVTETSVGPIALRTRRWKYHLGFGAPGRFEHLYDLLDDPTELHDVSDREPATTALLRLQTLEYLLLARSGHHVVVVAGDGETAVDRVVPGLTNPVTMIGIEAVAVDGGIAVGGATADRLAAVASVTVADAAAAPPPRRYRAGDLGRLLAAGKAAAVVFAGPPPGGGGAAGAAGATIDMRQLDALRAMGYVGDGKD